MPVRWLLYYVPILTGSLYKDGVAKQGRARHLQRKEKPSLVRFGKFGSVQDGKPSEASVGKRLEREDLLTTVVSIADGRGRRTSEGDGCKSTQSISVTGSWADVGIQARERNG